MMLANFIGNITNFSRFTFSLSSVIPLFNVNTEFHWIKMSKKQRQTLFVFILIRYEKNVRTPLSIWLFSFMIHVQFPSTQKQNKTWDFFFLFLFVTNKNKRWSFTCRGGWCHHTGKTDEINIRLQDLSTSPLDLWQEFLWLILSFDFPADCISQKYSNSGARAKMGKSKPTVWTLILLTTSKNFTLLPHFPKAIQGNLGSQTQSASDAAAILTFCWNQRMASSLRMRWLKPIRPVFRFLSAMLKPGLPRTWTQK